MMQYRDIALTDRKKLHALFTMLVKMTGNSDHSFDKSRVALVDYLKENSPYRVTEKSSYLNHSNKREFTGNMYAWAWTAEKLVSLILEFLNINTMNTKIEHKTIKCGFYFKDGRNINFSISVDTSHEDLYDYDLVLLSLCEYLDFKHDIYQIPQNENLFIPLIDQYEKYIHSYESKTKIDDYTTVYKQVVFCDDEKLDLIILNELHTGQLLVQISKFDIENESGELREVVQSTRLFNDEVNFNVTKETTVHVENI